MQGQAASRRTWRASVLHSDLAHGVRQVQNPDRHLWLTRRSLAGNPYPSGDHKIVLKRQR